MAKCKIKPIKMISGFPMMNPEFLVFVYTTLGGQVMVELAINIFAKLLFKDQEAGDYWRDLHYKMIRRRSN